MDKKCRFFISNTGHSIKCSGIIDGTSIKNIFAGHNEEALEKKAIHYETFCCDRYNCVNCPTYKAIMRVEDS